LENDVVKTFLCVSALAVTIASLPTPAAAQDFYKGKQITILVAGTAGGGIDIGARVMARHLGKYIPVIRTSWRN
jgi:tripartite-type tricarboxylate transporter receptor subunit TctC